MAPILGVVLDIQGRPRLGFAHGWAEVPDAGFEFEVAPGERVLELDETLDPGAAVELLGELHLRTEADFAAHQVASVTVPDPGPRGEGESIRYRTRPGAAVRASGPIGGGHVVAVLATMPRPPRPGGGA